MTDPRTIFLESGLEDEMTFIDFQNLVNDKCEKMSGLCDVSTAAKMVVKDLGGSLRKEASVQGTLSAPTSEKHITYTQTYDIRTKVGAEVDSKGNIKPSAQVEITRKLESGEDIYTLIHADMTRGLEEVQAAINEVLQKAGGQ